MQTTTIAIPIHSIVDLITNSSTVIYTWSDGSVQACKDMVDEMLKLFGVDKKCEDMFTIVSLINVEYMITEAGENYLPPELAKLAKSQNYDGLRKAVKNVLDAIKTGKTQKPEWLSKIESKEDYNGFRPTSTLYITPRSPEFEPLAARI